MYRVLSMLLIISGFFPFHIYALPEDAQQKIHVVADSSLVNYKSGTNTYEGNVKMNQGSTQLTADRIMTKNNEKHRIDEINVYGLNQLAEYATLPKPGDEIFRAKAKTIKYYPLKGYVILEGNVIVTQGKNSFQGPLIIYNMKDQVFNAPASKSGRATIVIEPNQFK